MAIIFHELTHIYAATDDYAYYNKNTDSYVNLRTNEPYAMTPAKAVDNGPTYERFISEAMQAGGK
jgi:hypothetical protein